MLDLAQLKSLFELSNLNLDLYFLDEIDSTNAFLKRRSVELGTFNLMPSLCLTHHQTHGYGQRSRCWQSSADSWTFSVLLAINLPLQALGGLSCVVGLSVQQTLAQYVSEPLYIKWPNDIWDKKGKVAGVLIESVSQNAQQTWLVIGIGINVSSQTSIGNTKFESTFENQCVDLASHQSLDQISPAGQNLTYPKSEIFFNPKTFYGDQFCQERVFVDLVLDILHSLKRFELEGFSPFLKAYKKSDKFQDGEEVIVYDSGSKINGIYRGLNDVGAIQIEIGGERKTYFSGTISIRKN